jgi:oligopeptide/dipeptide ABC transporter ATP-binding protein
MTKPLLRIENLCLGFQTEAGFLRVIENVSLDLTPGETLGLVGESGCGKSVTAQSILRLLPSPPSRVEEGHIWFDDKEILKLSQSELQDLRGNRIGMIFQEPMTSLNPTMTIGDQIAEPLRLHRKASAGKAKAAALDVLKRVGIGNAEQRLNQYPHELSGGLRQRVMIAMALICSPQMLIADEPTTALDVTIQAQILDLLRTLQKELGISILLITHDLGVVAETCNRVAVMYAGRIVETGTAVQVLTDPQHPYTRGLLAASPRYAKKGERMPTIAGQVPPPGKRGKGCPFAERCPLVMDKCAAMPPLEGAEHKAACWATTS